MSKQNLKRTIRQLLFGCITGILSGVVITLFLTCARVVIDFAMSVYSLERTPLAVTCTLILLILVCLTMAVVQYLCASAKGSGIPLAEGLARGMLSVKWLRSAAALIAGSLLSFLCALPLGSEGPSVGVGGLIGEGVGRAAGQPVQQRRYLITGGSSAGLAVAFNAPLTGVTFALEETHGRFSPSILIAAFSAVIPAVLVSQLMYFGFGFNAYLSGLGIRAGAAVLPFLDQHGYDSVGVFFAVCGIAAMCGAGCALLAALFNACITKLSALLGKLKNPVLRLAPAFTVTAVCGLCLAQAVGSGEGTFASVSITTSAWLLIGLLALRFVLTVVAGGSGATGGLFLPMIAVGGLLGTLAAKGAISAGLPSAYAPNVIILCIAAFFAASVRAPVSAIALSFELTSSFANPLPCTIAVGLAAAITALLRSAPLYERMLRNLYNENAPRGEDITVRGIIPISSAVCGKRISDILWPYNSLVTELTRNDVELVPDGETVLEANDTVTLRAENVVRDTFTEQINDYITIIQNRN